MQVDASVLAVKVSRSLARKVSGTQVMFKPQDPANRTLCTYLLRPNKGVPPSCGPVVSSGGIAHTIIEHTS